MTHYLQLSLLATASLLVLVACQATPDSSIPATAPQPTSSADQPATSNTPSPTTPTPAPLTERAAASGTTPTATSAPTTSPGRAADADVLHVRAVQASDDTWTFHVTVRHPDTGWEDYADGWDVVTPDGTVIKPDPESPFTRLLLHPHENEQPFTRSQSGIVIPPDATQVRVRAHDLVDGYGGREVIVDLAVNSGPDFEVERKSSAAINVRVQDSNEYSFSPLLPFDGIPPVYDPKFASAAEAPLHDDELVIGIALGGEAKAYPITVLRYREMVNDELGGVPILVTW